MSQTSAYPVNGPFAADAAIKAFLERAPGRTGSYADLRRAVFCAPGTLRNAVERMQESGQLRRLGWGVYALP